MGKNTSSHGAGPTQRQLRVGELIRRAMSEALMRGEIHDPDLNRMSITVGEVTVTHDLRIATAYVLPLGGHEAQAAVDAMRRNKWQLRQILNKKLTLKLSPELRFEIDRTFDQMDNTRRLFEQDDVRRDLED